MDYFDIGTFCGTIQQRDELLAKGLTIGQFVEVVGLASDPDMLIVHCGEPLPEHMDSSHIIQKALDTAMELSGSNDDRNSTRVSIGFPVGEFQTSNALTLKEAQRQAAIEKPKIQDKQAYYRNFICK